MVRDFSCRGDCDYSKMVKMDDDKSIPVHSSEMWGERGDAESSQHQPFYEGDIGS